MHKPSILLFAALLPVYALAQEQTCAIAYRSNAAPGTGAQPEKAFPAKSQFFSCDAGIIKPVFKTTAPDSVKNTVLAACETWGGILKNRYPIAIDIHWLGSSAIRSLNLCGDRPMEVEVYYADTANGTKPVAAQSLAGTSEETAASVYLNSDFKFRCSMGEVEPESYDLYTYTLQALARATDIGTSIRQTDGGAFAYAFGEPSEYDKMLYFKDTPLSGVNPASAEFSEMVNASDNLAVKIGKYTYSLYCPEAFSADESLNYLDNPSSLLFHGLGMGDYITIVDNPTRHMAYTLGWKASSGEPSISGRGIGAGGVCKASESHSFSLKDPAGDATYSWAYYRFAESGERMLIKSGSGAEFTIDGIAEGELGNWQRNSFGDIRGVVECTMNRSGTATLLQPCSLSLETAPSVEVFDMVHHEVPGTFNFYLTFKVRFTGGERVSLGIEEELDGIVRRSYKSGPSLVQFRTGEISSLFYSWVDVTVSNSVGEATRTFEFEPDYGDNPSFIGFGPDAAETVRLEVYSIDGLPVGSFASEAEMKAGLRQGLYIVVARSGNGVTSARKVRI